jgi:hypothetical protein
VAGTINQAVDSAMSKISGERRHIIRTIEIAAISMAT